MKWISLKEKRPEERQKILVFGELVNDGSQWPLHHHNPIHDNYYLCEYRSLGCNREFSTLYWKDKCGNKGYCDGDGYVVHVSHWIPLPDKPEQTS
jgi:hypothetical protein